MRPSSIFKFAMAACAAVLHYSMPANASERSLQQSNPDDIINIGHGVSIFNTILNEMINGNPNPCLTLNAQVIGSLIDIFSVEVCLTEQALTPETTFSNDTGPEVPIGELGSITLVVNVEVEEPGTVAIVTVDMSTGEVNGIVHRDGQRIKLSQINGEFLLASEAPDNVNVTDWECLTDELEQQASTRHLKDAREEEYHSRHHKSTDIMEEPVSYLRESLPGSNIHFGERRRLAGKGYSFQVDLTIEYDTLLLVRHLFLAPLVHLYINSIVTGANTVYEPEIDTHMNIIKIEYTTRYDGVDKADDALAIMQNDLSGANWKGGDLHHAFISRVNNGGIAYLESICDTNIGFGLSGGIRGDFQSMDSRTIWDMEVFMHEVGHNFGSGHTHTIETPGYPWGYNPIIDSCGCELGFLGCPPFRCPSELPKENAATLMSYCHTCDAEITNIAYTFGGQYISGDRALESSYITSPALTGTFNEDPRRVNVKMYKHVSTRPCTAVPTPQPTGSPTRSPSRSPSLSPTSGPSGSPTSSPSKSPSSSPTFSPSGKPSLQPSEMPSNQPSMQPSMQPSKASKSVPKSSKSVSKTSKSKTSKADELI